MERLTATYRVGEGVRVSLPGESAGDDDAVRMIDDPVRVNPPGSRILIVGHESAVDTPLNLNFAAHHTLTFDTADTDFRPESVVAEIVEVWKSAPNVPVKVDLMGFSGLPSSVSRMAQLIASETDSDVNVTLW